MENIDIENNIIGKNRPVFIIAEAGVNHNGKFDLAKKLIDVAKNAGADAVKFQSFQADILSTKTAVQCSYQKENIGQEESQYKMLKRLELPRKFHAPLKEYCREKKIVFLSTPFSEDDADYLENLGVAAFKIPSGEINNYPYLKHIAKKGKPMIVSTGMSTMEEVKRAINIIKENGNKKIILLHCTTNYPASPESLNLKVIKTMQKELDVPIGYSDHSEGSIAGIATVALEACIIEKHFTLDRDMEGPDHKASLEPRELKAMIKAIRKTELMLGDEIKKCTDEEIGTLKVIRKSIVAKRNLKKDKIITLDDLIIKRPGTGIPPNEIDKILGKKTVKKINEDSLIIPDDLKK